MPTINQLDSITSVQSADQVPLYSSSDGDARKASMNVLGEYFQQLLTDDTKFAQQRTAPSATGWTITVSAAMAGQNIWLLIKPTAGFAAGTITLPNPTTCIDGQQLLVSCTQAATALTVNGSGATVNGAPTSLAANGFFRLRFDVIDNAWFRIG